MNKLAISIAVGLGLSINLSSIAADSNTDKTGASKASTSAAGVAMPPADVTSNAPGKPETKKEKKQDKKLAKKLKKNAVDVDGDGTPMGKLGGRKSVDGGFDFDNSKKFHRMGNPTP